MTDPRRSRIDRGWAVAVAAIACVAVGLGVSAWVFAPRSVDAGIQGARMAISLVAPREPEIREGDVLEVGALSDGFDRAALDRSMEIDDPTWLPPEAYAGPGWDPADAPRMPMPTPAIIAPEFLRVERPAQSVAAPDPLADGSRLFGFDRSAPKDPVDRARRMAALEEAERAAGLSQAGATPAVSTSAIEYSSE